MFILREVFLVLMVFAPLLIALPLAVSGIKQKVRVNYKSGLGAIFIVVAVGIFSVPINEAHYNIVLVTALAMGIYVAISYTNRRPEFYAYIISILLTGIIALIVVSLAINVYGNTVMPKVYNAKRYSSTSDIKQTLIKYAADKSFPAGYIEKNSPILTSLPASEEKDIEAKLIKISYSWKAIHRWHTQITGLYYVDRKKVYLWYPGGKIKDKVDNIRWQKKAGE